MAKGDGRSIAVHRGGNVPKLKNKVVGSRLGEGLHDRLRHRCPG